MEELLQAIAVTVVGYILFVYIVRKLNDMFERWK